MSAEVSFSGLAVCIATRDRPVGLRRLLSAVADLEPPSIPVRVVVVDNGSEPPIAPIVESFAGRLAVEVIREERLGIPFARNAALDRLGDSELMACTDDDCVPSRTWLVDLMATMQATSADAVGGVVRYVPPEGSSAWLHHVGFESPVDPDGAPLRHLATNNCMFTVQSLRDRGLRFDERFPLLGGEDSWLSEQLTLSGGRLHLAAAAMVDEYLPPGRVSVRWLVRRRFRYGYGATLRRLHEHRVRAWWSESARIVVRLALAAGLAVAGVVCGRRVVLKALLRAALAAGSVWALVGGKYADYRVTDGG